MQELSGGAADSQLIKLLHKAEFGSLLLFQLVPHFLIAVSVLVHPETFPAKVCSRSCLWIDHIHHSTEAWQKQAFLAQANSAHAAVCRQHMEQLGHIMELDEIIIFGQSMCSDRSQYDIKP